MKSMDCLDHESKQESIFVFGDLFVQAINKGQVGHRYGSNRANPKNVHTFIRSFQETVCNLNFLIAQERYYIS